MNCVHGERPPQQRPRTVVTFSDDEVAEALRDYAMRMGQQMPTGKMHWDTACGTTQLTIRRGEGQDVWPPEAVGDGV